jgi:hypothetical protein
VAHGKQRQVPERRHEQHRVRARRRELQPVDNIVPKSSFKVYGHAPLPSLDPEDAMPTINDVFYSMFGNGAANNVMLGRHAANN